MRLLHRPTHRQRHSTYETLSKAILSGDANSNDYEDWKRLKISTNLILK